VFGVRCSIIRCELPNTCEISFLCETLIIKAFPCDGSTVRHFPAEHLRQRVCEPHFAARDLMAVNHVELNNTAYRSAST